LIGTYLHINLFSWKTIISTLFDEVLTQKLDLCVSAKWWHLPGFGPLYNKKFKTLFEDRGTILVLKFGTSHRKYRGIEAWSRDRI